MIAFLLDTPIIKKTNPDEKFLEACNQNPEARIERSLEGEIIIMPPTGGETGYRNSSLTSIFWNWNKKNKLGLIFDSSTAFKPLGQAIFSPDVSFIKTPRWEKLNAEERKKFAPIAPDFVLELVSESDSIKKLQKKMEDWILVGVNLAWLLDLDEKTLYIYRKNKKVEILKNITKIKADQKILPNFTLDISKI